MKSAPRLINAVTALLILFIVLAAQRDRTEKPSNTKSIMTVKDDGHGGKKGDVYRIYFNNIDLPVASNGVIADAGVNRGLEYTYYSGQYDGITFLFSSGFYIGGLDNGEIWASAQASASRRLHFTKGTWEVGQEDPRAQLYVLKTSDGDFHQSWIDWKDAVTLGAEFYDGDGDGIYNPIDKNNNGYWDEDEDRPDLIGDETVWCVFHDGFDPADDNYNWGFENKGIDICQTIFGFDSEGMLGNVLFVRYSLENTGITNDVLDSVYFGVWADPDVGNYENDYVGSDTTLKVGFVYDKDVDAEYGNSPSLIFDILQGPVVYVPGETFVDENGNGFFDPGETVLDSAIINRGAIRGIQIIPGAENRGASSFINYLKSHPTLGGPNNEYETYNYLHGLDPRGNKINPCSFSFSEVRGGADCSLINPFWWYSGDPVEDVGWILTKEWDQRMMLNVGPFELRKGETQEIIAAYIVGRGSTSLLSINEAKRIDNLVKTIFQQNFEIIELSPEFTKAIIPEIRQDDASITLTWETAPLVNFQQVDYDLSGNALYDMRFEGYEVYMFRSTADRNIFTENNSVKIASYDLRNEIGDILIEDTDTGLRTLLFEKGVQLDSEIFGNETTGRLTLNIDTDPFTGSTLIKGKPYFIAITAYGINRDAIFKLYPDKVESDIYQISPKTDFTYIKTPVRILEGNEGIICGEDLNTPYREGVEIEHVAGPSEAIAKYNIIYRDKVRSDVYEVGFEKDTSAQIYTLMWNVRNISKDEMVLDSITIFNQTIPNYLADGVMLDINWIKPKLLQEEFKDGLVKWFASERAMTGALYSGKDIDTLMLAMYINNTSRSKVTTFDKTRRVELRFGQPSMAYRYVKAGGSLRYLHRTPDDPIFGKGFVEVPFSAWVKDDHYGEEYQLATGYLEKQPGSNDTLSFIDEKWNPGYDINESGEYIVIFSSPYDPTGSNVVYTGTGTGTAAAKHADIGNGYRININDPNYFITDSMAAVAESPWFDAMYLVALEIADSIEISGFNPTGTYVININYPLTTSDNYRYTPSLELTKSEKESLFDKVNVYPNPFFGYNEISGSNPSNQFVSFINLPEAVEIKIYSLGGSLVRTLGENDKSNPKSPFIRWDLRNENGYRVGSGMYFALVTSPGLGEKVLKFAVVQGKKYKTL